MTVNTGPFKARRCIRMTISNALVDSLRRLGLRTVFKKAVMRNVKFAWRYTESRGQTDPVHRLLTKLPHKPCHARQLMLPTTTIESDH